MLLDIRPHKHIANRFFLETTGSAKVFFERSSNSFYITTNKYEDENGSCEGWWFLEKDLKEAAELFLRLADELHDEDKERSEDQ